MLAERIGVCQWCLPGDSRQETMETARELGFGVLQPTSLGNGKPTKAEWRQFLKLADQCELTISGFSGYMDFGTAEGIEGRIQLEKSFLDLSTDLANPMVITEAGGAPFAEGEEWRRCWETLVGAMKELADYAAKVGSYVAMEPGGGGLVASVESMRDLLAEVDNPHLKLNLDPANIIMFGGDPVRAARELGEHVIHTHAKDAVFHYPVTHEEYKRVAGKYRTPDELLKLLGRDTPPFAEVPLGQGHVNWKQYLGALDDAGYSGPLVIERETGDNPVEDIVLAKRFLETV